MPIGEYGLGDEMIPASVADSRMFNRSAGFQKRLCRLIHATNRRAPNLSPIDLVEINLQYFFFAQRSF